MSDSIYSIIYDSNCATLFARTKGRMIPLVSSTDRLKLQSIYRNIKTGEYKNVRELCKDIHNNFSTQATLLVLVTLFSTAHSSSKRRFSR